jgi:hypothetical protein
VFCRPQSGNQAHIYPKINLTKPLIVFNPLLQAYLVFQRAYKALLIKDSHSFKVKHRFARFGKAHVQCHIVCFTSNLKGLGFENTETVSIDEPKLNSLRIHR